MAGHQVESNVLSKSAASRRLDVDASKDHTDDLSSRERLHNRGHGAKYTASRLPVRIVYAEEHESSASAIAREYQIKRWSARKKEALIVGDGAVLRTVGRRKPRRPVAVLTWRDLLNRQS